MKETKSKSLPVSKLMVWYAYKKVKANRGSAGIDGISLEKFEQKLEDNLYKIWNRMASGSYFPPAVKEVEIPKKDGKVRKLGIPTVADRIAQMVIKDLVEGRFEQIFSPNSYGYRPLKSAHQALEAVKQNARKYNWVIDLDIKGFFDNIDHELLMKAVEVHVSEKWIRMYIRRWLGMPVQTKSGELVYKEGKGTPQGGVISPLLANLFLHYVLDVWLSIKFSQISFVRYADDAIIHCRTQSEAESVLKAINDRVLECKLQLHKDKTKIAYCKDYRRRDNFGNVKFDFLGFSFHPKSLASKRNEGRFLGYGMTISRDSRKKIVSSISKTKFNRWTTAKIEDIANLLNPKIRGWINYYGQFCRRELNQTFRRLNWRIAKWLLNKYKRLKRSLKKAYILLRIICKSQPNLFAYWKAGYDV
jgi:RNA-directed DNA polymerase